MTKLKDLSAQGLADLLGLPLGKARRWLEVAASLSAEEDSPLVRLFGDLESATSLRRSSVRELMELSVEEIESLKSTGEFRRRFPYFERKRPNEPEARLRYLRELLGGEAEFEARYPAAFEVLFQGSEARRGLPLPSFDVRVLDNDPRTTVLPAGWHTDARTAQNSADAFSDTFGTEPPGREEADQGFAPLERVVVPIVRVVSAVIIPVVVVRIVVPIVQVIVSIVRAVTATVVPVIVAGVLLAVVSIDGVSAVPVIAVVAIFRIIGVVTATIIGVVFAPVVFAGVVSVAGSVIAPVVVVGPFLPIFCLVAVVVLGVVSVFAVVVVAAVVLALSRRRLVALLAGARRIHTARLPAGRQRHPDDGDHGQHPQQLCLLHLPVSS
jgi:hypothetical protein